MLYVLEIQLIYVWTSRQMRYVAKNAFFKYVCSEKDYTFPLFFCLFIKS